MILYDLQKSFSSLPDDLKIEALNFIDFLHFKVDKHNQSGILLDNKKIHRNEIISKSEPIKKISAKQLMSLSHTERKSILKKQAAKAKIMYEQNPDLLVPDLIDDIKEY
jgi:hypothetical protein